MFRFDRAKRSGVPRVQRLALGASLALLAIPLGAGAEGTEQERGFFLGGKTTFSLYHRFEMVDDESNDLDSATASTVRAFLGYSTASVAGFSLNLGIEGVTDVGSDDFNVPGEPSRGFDVVADPTGLEIDEAYVRYQGFKNTDVRVGRQYVAFRKAPLQRFVGPVPWRQNWQSMDALRVIHKPVDGLKLDYVYVDNVNRIFGEDNPNEALANSPMSTHLLNVTVDELPFGALEAFYYRLDYDNDALPAPFTDRSTFGVKLQGARALASGSKFLYLAEVSRQEAIADNATPFERAHQLRLEAGVKLASGLVTKLGYEVLGSDEGVSFATPLATVHAFQGWADRFIGFPGGGVRDRYAIVATDLPLGLKFLGAYHDFEAATGGIDYGSEVNLQVTRKVGRATLQLRHASYFGDGDPAAGAQGFDKTITWFSTRFSL